MASSGLREHRGQMTAWQMRPLLSVGNLDGTRPGLLHPYQHLPGPSLA